MTAPATSQPDHPVSTPWTFDEAPPALHGFDDGVTTLVEGQTFCLSGVNGDIKGGRPHGLFVLDTRVLSEWSLTIDGCPPDALAVDLPAPFQARFVGSVRLPSQHADHSLLVIRERSVGEGMREVITVRNVGLDPVTLRIGLTCAVDFANLFEVKEGRPTPPPVAPVAHTSHLVSLRRDDGSSVLETAIRLSRAATLEADEIVWTEDLASRAEFEVCIEVVPAVDGVHRPMRFHCRGTDPSLPAERLAHWRSTTPAIRSDVPAFDAAVQRGLEDLGALRIFDPSRSDRPVIAAGAPWFMALFGRDSLLTGWMSLLADADLAVGVVETLAALQGREVRPDTEEEPGKILHEARLCAGSRLSLHGGAPYYGSVDATPLFVMLVGELHRWGVDDCLIMRMMPHVDAALAWIERYGDRDGDGYVEYARSTENGLANQGWKDSWDAIRFADSRLAEAPIALCEVQGYVYGAYRARADLARAQGDSNGARHWAERAEHLRTAFNRDFWIEDRGCYALGLDADKRPIDALASNVGHCLWTGIVDPERAGQVARLLMSPEMFSGWGLRTLATTMRAYNPLSYHNGSVWPHDTALATAGLMRYGCVDEAHRLLEGLIAATTHHAGRLPELFSGIARDDIGRPVPYPTSCSPQAWAAAAPLLLVRTVLRLDPDVPNHQIWVAPDPPPSMHAIHVDDITVAGQHLSIRVDGSRVEIEGISGLTINPAPLSAQGQAVRDR